MSASIKVTLWGVRGSHPAPGPHTVRFGGNTTSIQVQAGRHLIILDAGTGIIELGRMLAAQARAEGRATTATLLFTHTHHDHTQGFPFFVPAFSDTSNLYIFGPKTLNQDLEEVLSRTMMPPVFPITLEELPCERETRNLLEGQVIVFDSDTAAPRVLRVESHLPPEASGGVHIHVMRSYAHPQGVFFYRIEHGAKSMVFATDTEGYLGGDRRLIEFARDADLLIHDAQYTQEEYGSARSPRQGWGHSTWKMAVEVAQAARVKQLLLFHHDPTHTDEMLAEQERLAQAVFPRTRMACEGETIDL